MVDEFIKLFTGYQGDFGIADMSSAQLDAEKNKHCFSKKITNST